MRLPILKAVFLFACVCVKPAAATPITTVTFSGVITAAGLEPGSPFVLPALGTPWNLTLTFSPLLEETFFIFQISGWGYAVSPSCTICTTSIWESRPAGTFFPEQTTGFGTGPNGSSFITSLLQLTLDEGWHAGSMSVFIDAFARGGGFAGSITSVTKGPVARVHEPATALMLALGLCALAGARLRLSTPHLRRRSSSNWTGRAG